MADLVQFGPYNLTQEKCLVQRTDERSHPDQQVQRMAVARRPGTTAVNEDYNEKTLSFRGRIKRPSGHTPTFRDIEDEFDNAMSKVERTLRVCRNYINITDADTDTNWSGSDDAANVTTSNADYQLSNASLSFDVDVSASGNNYATVSNSSLTAVDLSSVEDTGNLEFWIYIPDNQYVSSVDVRWGSDSSNYWYENSISSNYEGKSLETGWNYISVYWPTATQESSPDASAVDYLFVRVNYSSSMVDETGFLLNGFKWIDDDETVNYTSTVLSVSKAEGHANIDWLPITIQFLCTNPFAYNTHEIQEQDRDTLVSANKTLEITFDGSYGPDPRIVYTMNTAESLSAVTYRNDSTNEEMTVATVWTAEDVLVLDMSTLSCTLSGVEVEYEGVFPRHVAGLNVIKTSMTTSNAETVSTGTRDGFTGALDDAWTDRADFAIGQSFQVTGNDDISYIQTEVFQAYASNVATAYVEIRNDNGSDMPGTTVLGSTSISCGNWGTNDLNPTTLTMYFPGATTLTGGTTYWLVFSKQSGTEPQSMYFGMDSGGGYANGECKKLSDWNGSNWDTGGTVSGGYPNLELALTIQTSGTFLANYDWDVYYKKKFV